ncbi:unnamed protein product [Euphydryas editha]|uniref:DUF7869 domain-containing protein n=1 Tax=Euphydryas editha TaxID=104508 RepID=A0AAU9U257_EUPED|nr:unnamed protein product [Euphydryas editha]
MMSERLMKIRNNFKKPPDAIDKTASVSSNESLNVSVELLNQQDSVAENDTMSVSQPDVGEPLETTSSNNIHMVEELAQGSITNTVENQQMSVVENETVSFHQSSLEETMEVTKDSHDVNTVELLTAEINQNTTYRACSNTSSTSSSSSSSNSEDSNEDENQDTNFPGVDSDDSVKDPNYGSSSRCTDSTSSDSELDDIAQTGSAPEELQSATSPLIVEGEISRNPLNEVTNTRKRKKRTQNWIRVKAKRLRNTGKSYVSRTNKVIPEKKIGPPCTEKCRQKCSSKIPEEKRMTIFKNFYELSDLNRQRQFIVNSIDVVRPKYRYSNAAKPRQNNYAYHLNVNENMIRVCKSFFKSTLSINDKVINTALKKKDSNLGNVVAADLRGKHGNHLKIPDSIKFDIREHINCIPTIDSHYCRSNTSKRYIDGGRSLAQYYRDYVNDCKKQNKPFAHYLTYHHIFNNEFNIAFHSPKKDLCDTCVAFNNAVGDAKENLKANYDKHLAEKDQSRKEKEVDKNRLDNVVVAVYDLQAVLPCPRGDVSNFYYLSKLNVLNFTIYNLKSKEVECYAWHEGDGNRGVNEIATCVWKYLDKLSNNAVEPFHVVFYSDNCCGQQKNKFMIYTYLLALTKFPKILSITHKFLIKGHSANEGDSAHSLIERRIKASLKSNPIYSPDHYYYLIRSAKVNGKPFILNELSHDSFFDIKTATDKIGKSLPPKNTVNEPFKVTDIRIVKVSTENKDTIFYKTSYFDTDFKEIKLFSATRRNKPDLNNINFEQLYEEKIKISDQKKKGFINLIEKNIIPQYYRTFYENL